MDEGQRLLVTFEARLNKYERDLERGKSRSRTNFRAMQKEAETAGSGIEKAMGGALKSLGAFGKGLAGGAIGALAVGGLDQIIGRVAALTKGVAEIGDAAKMAGLSNRAFQELGYVAEQNRIPIDALTDAMKELAIRGDEFATTGKGGGADSFMRMGYSAEELGRKLKNPSDLLLEIIDRMGRLDAAARIRVFDEVFGGQGGEKFVQLIDRGADGIRRTIAEAHELGIVLDDDVIQRADEIDRKFSKIATTVSTNLKAAIVDIVSDMDDWLDRFNRIEEQATSNVQLALSKVYDDLREAKNLLSDLELDKAAFPGDAALDLNIDRQKQLIEELTGEALKLRDILDRRNGYDEGFIYKTGEDAAGTKPPIDNLNNALSGTGSAAGNAVSGLKSYGDAIRALKEEVPELAASLRDLDAKTRIDQTYRAALSKARTMGEVYLANELRGQALASVNIPSATDDPAGYLSSALASGKARSHIDGMADAFASKLTKLLASMPDDLKGSVTINSGYRSVERQAELWADALRKYGSPEAARKWVAPPGRSQHNKGNAADLGFANDRAQQWVHQNAEQYGLRFRMSHEDWHIEDADAFKTDRSAEVERMTAVAGQQADAYQQIIAGSREYTAAQQALAMTGQQAAAFRFEQQMLAEAQRSGITLTDQQRQEIATLAQGMASADASVQTYVASQEQAAEVSRFFGEQAVDALSGLLSGTMSAEEALQNLIQTLIRAALQAAILGEGPLAGLLGGSDKPKPKPKTPAGGGGKKGFGSILGSILGLKDGGHVRGPGTATSDSIPARLSNGEFVVNAKATRKNRAVLEAINSGSVASFAAGGYAGDAPAVRRPDLVAANSNAAPVQNITISAPVTVNAQGGDPAQNADLAKQVGRQMEQQMRGLVQDEFRKQFRPGNYGWQRTR
jgi:hypothetical protein